MPASRRLQAQAMPPDSAAPAAGPTAAPAATAGELPPWSAPFAQVAFAGHNRPGDLGDVAAVRTGLDTAFERLKAAGLVQGRLLTGLAPGADTVAAEAWRAAGLGPIHAVNPFLDDPAQDPPPTQADSATWLDGAAAQQHGRNAHLAQTRWLIGAADLLVAVWTGRQARGAGGTADAVRLALEHGIPVLWVVPKDPHPPRLIRPEYLDEDFGFLEVVEELAFNRPPLVREATPERLRAALSDLGLGERSAAAGEDAAALDGGGARRKRGVAWLWRTYSVFRRVLGGKAAPFEARPPPDDLAAQEGFARLSRALDVADEQASRLGAVHRSHQVILLGVAILAALAGSASALWPGAKLAMVAVELILAIGALLVWLDSERGERHRRWGDARRLAEDFRLERAAWALGISTTAHGVHVPGNRPTRQVRRLTGPPHGAFDAARVAAWGDWVIEELITGQVAYHREQATINGRISHRVHQLENVSFGLLLLVMVSYLAAAAALAGSGRDPPDWLAGLMLMAGAVVPAIGAAGLALEATLALGEQARRSQVLSAQLASLTTDLEPAPVLERRQAIAKAAIRLLRVQEDHWTEDAARRRLVRGG